MRLGWNYTKLTALVSVLGLTIWTIGCAGCADNSTPTKPIAAGKSNGHEAGSTKGGGTDVPAAEGDSGAAKPEADKPADDKADKPADDKKDEPKADADKPADADKKDEPKADDAKKDEK